MTQEISYPKPHLVICRSAIYDNESLYSFLVRLSDMNMYLFPIYFQWLCSGYRLGKTNEFVTHPKSYVVFSRLSALTGIPIATLEKASLGRFGYRELRHYNREAFCPDCLKEKKYHRMYWSIRNISACVKHKKLLVEYCQSCGSALHRTAVARGECGKCGFDLRKASTPTLKDDEIGMTAQALIYLNYFNMSYCSTADLVNLKLPTDDPKWLYWCLSILAGFTKDISNEQFFYRLPNLSVSKSTKSYSPMGFRYIQWATAFRSLTRFPENFKEFAWVLSINSIDFPYYNYPSPHYVYWLWERLKSCPGFLDAGRNYRLGGEFIFGDTVICKQKDSESSNENSSGYYYLNTCKYMTIKEAAAQLHTCERVIRALIKIKALKLFAPMPTPFGLLDRQDVKQLEKNLKKFKIPSRTI